MCAPVIYCSKMPIARIECLFKFGLILSALSACLASQFNPAYATELDLIIRKPLFHKESSRVSYSDERINGAWLNSESDIIKYPLFAIRLDRKEVIGAEYRQQSYSFKHNGQFGKLICSFLGCSYAGSKLLNGKESAEIAMLSIRSHAIFLNDVLPPNQIISNVDISIGYLNGDAHLVGFGMSSNYQGGLPTLGVRLGLVHFLSEVSKVQANIVPSFFYSKNGHVGLLEVDFLYSYAVTKSFDIGIGLVSTWHSLKYKNVDRFFQQESNILNPFFQVNYRLR